MRRLNILLLVVAPGSPLSNTLRDHVGAFRRYSRHRVYVQQNDWALLHAPGSVVEKQLGEFYAIPSYVGLEAFDAVAIHYSNYVAHPQHMDPVTRERLRSFRGLKVMFIQDEYRTVDATVNAMRELAIDVLYTCVPESEVEKVYPESQLPGVRKLTTLTGFVPEGLLRQAVPPLRARTIDVGYRARQVPYWLGALGAEKWQIAPKFMAAASGSGLRCDISSREEDRIYGRGWIRFLKSCRSVLGTESGASVFDFSGELQRTVNRYVTEHPGASYEEVHDRYLAEHEGRIRLNQISPRCFEAAALRTAMVLYEGEYSGVLQPERHYLPLRKDFANFDAVLRSLRDVPALQGMADRAYREVAASGKYSYRGFVEGFDAVVEQEVLSRGILPPENSARDARRSGAALARLRATRAASRLRYGLLMLRYRLSYVLHRMAERIYMLYVRVLPESIRAKLRPFLRRYVLWERR